MRILFLTDRRFKRHRLLCNLQNIADLVNRHVHFFGNFFSCRIVAEFLQKLTGNPDGFIDGFYHMHGNADGTCLIGNGSCNGLADPPGGVG